MNTPLPRKARNSYNHEKMIAEKLDGAMKRWSEIEEEEARQHFLRRWLGTISLFRLPLALLVLGGTVLLCYRFVSKVLGNVIVGGIASLVGAGFFYAAFFLVSEALGGDGYRLWRQSFSSFRRANPSKGDISSERFGLFVGAGMYLMFGLVFLVVAYGMFRGR